jgi:hypothetical protein
MELLLISFTKGAERHIPRNISTGSEYLDDVFVDETMYIVDSLYKADVYESIGVAINDVQATESVGSLTILIYDYIWYHRDNSSGEDYITNDLGNGLVVITNNKSSQSAVVKIPTIYTTELKSIIYNKRYRNYSLTEVWTLN